MSELLKNLLINDKVKIKIIISLSQPDSPETISALSERIGHKHETVEKAVRFLERIRVVETHKRRHQNREFTYITLTDLGKELKDKLEVD